MLDESNNLVDLLRSRDIMLYPAEHVLIELWSRVEIIEGEYLIPMLKLLCALCLEMVADYDELLTLMFAEPAFKHQLLLGLLKGLTDSSTSIDACQVE